MNDKSFRDYTYIRRKGRITPAQTRGLAALEHYTLTPSELVEVAKQKPLGIEIGFGMGHALLQWAQSQPDWILCGIELYQPGIGALLDGMARLELANIYVIAQPAQEVAAALSAPIADEVRIFFPDPWPKKRHHKRRLIQPAFLPVLAKIVKKDGKVRLATDWDPYAAWMRECFAASDDFVCELDHVRGAADEALQASDRDTTNFERRGEKLGHNIHDFIFRRL